MSANSDFKDLFRLFNEEEVEFLVVGAHAVMYYTTPRYTKVLDLWVNPTPENARRVHAALKKYGAPLIDVVPEDFTDQNLVYQVGIEPNRFDILMGISGLKFESAWSDKQTTCYEDVPINILGKRDLNIAKKASGRPQDLLDVENLVD